MEIFSEEELLVMKTCLARSTDPTELSRDIEGLFCDIDRCTVGKEMKNLVDALSL